MRLFPYQPDQPYYGAFASQIHELMIETIHSMDRFQKKHEIVQTAMFIFHAHAKLTSYHSFDRFTYAIAAILLGSKMNDEIAHCSDIVMFFRIALRKLRSRDGQDSPSKLKSQTRKVLEAEIVLMINIGFDLDIYTGISYLQKWEKRVGDSIFYEQIAKTITKLYQTTLCLYYEPQDLALCGLSMAIKENGITPQLCGWKPDFYNYFMNKKTKIDEIHDEFSTRLNLIHG